MTPEERDFADWLLAEALDAAAEEQDAAPSNEVPRDYGYGTTGWLLGNVLRENGFGEDEIPGMLRAAHLDALGDATT